MNLEEYLFFNDLKISEFSKKMKCSAIYLGGVINGRYTPSLRFAEDIERKTGGYVTVESICGKKMEGAEYEKCLKKSRAISSEQLTFC